MSMAKTIEETAAPPSDSKGALVVMATLTPMMVYGEKGADPILEKITKEVRAVPLDISTPKGREAVASLAYKIARSKTALDDMGKQLVADWKAKATAVDSERRRIRENLDALKDEVRKPLTDWENADKRRIEAHEAAIAEIIALGWFPDAEPPLAEVDRRLAALQAPPRDWQEFAKRAGDATAASLARLTATRDATVKREAERAELERHRREETERLQKERDDRLRAEAAEKARREAEDKANAEAKAAAEKVEAEKRTAAEEAERQRQKIEREKREAEEATAREQARAKKAEDEARQQREQRLAAERKAKEDREAAARKVEADKKAAAEKAERDKAAAIEAERKRVADAKAAEAAALARREASRKHVEKIHGEARAALVASGLSEAAATTAIVAIAGGKVPHIEISY
jgi:hypothetical protein